MCCTDEDKGENSSLFWCDPLRVKACGCTTSGRQHERHCSPLPAAASIPLTAPSGKYNFHRKSTSYEEERRWGKPRLASGESVLHFILVIGISDAAVMGTERREILVKWANKGATCLGRRG